jgi:hypothetical protein
VADRGLRDQVAEIVRERAKTERSGR